LTEREQPVIHHLQEITSTSYLNLQNAGLIIISGLVFAVYCYIYAKQLVTARLRAHLNYWMGLTCAGPDRKNILDAITGLWH